MTTDTLPADHQIGANNPPSPMEIMRERSQPLIVGALVAAIFGPPHRIDDVEGLENAAKFVKGSRLLFKDVDGLRDDIKRPYDNASKEVQNWFMPALTALEIANKVVARAIGDYNDRVAEDERKRAATAALEAKAEAERRFKAADSLLDAGLDDAASGVAETGVKMEAQAAQLSQQASGSTADLARQRTSYGTTTSKVEWTDKITDQPALRKTLGKLGPHFTEAELQKAVRAYRVAAVKAGQVPDLKGVTFTKGSIGAVR